MANVQDDVPDVVHDSSKYETKMREITSDYKELIDDIIKLKNIPILSNNDKLDTIIEYINSVNFDNVTYDKLIKVDYYKLIRDLKVIVPPYDDGATSTTQIILNIIDKLKVLKNRLIYIQKKGGKKSKKLPKKEILGKMRCIYKIPGDKKEYLKHKGKLITVKEYKELMKAKPKKKEAKPKKVKKTKSKK
jgi:hypothetical protein